MIVVDIPMEDNSADIMEDKADRDRRIRRTFQRMKLGRLHPIFVDLET
jgi:hypothetical protein